MRRLLLARPARPACFRMRLGELVPARTHKVVAASDARLSVEQNIPRWIAQEHLPPRAHAGARVFATAGCTACHTYDGARERPARVEAPDLRTIVRRHLGIRFKVNHLKSPARVNHGSPMPPFGSLGRKRLGELAIFLESSKGIR